MSDPLDWPLLDVLAGTIVGEASNQEMIGQIAIGCVIRNRARIAEAFFKRTGQSYWWAKVAGIPSTDVWRSVMLKPWQFTCWTDSLRRISNNRARNSVAWETAMQIAPQIHDGRTVDVTAGADHYFADYISPPAWSRGKQPVMVIGPHRFYRLVGAS